MKMWILRVALLIAIAVVTIVGLIEPPNPFYVPPVQAAAPANIVNACEKIATTGEIDYYYCQGDIGPAFVANSVGFVAIEQ